MGELNTEGKLLALFLQTPGLYEKMSSLRPEYFSNTGYQEAFKAMQTLSDTGNQIDSVTVLNVMSRNERLRPLAAGLVDDLRHYVPPTDKSLEEVARSYGEIVKDDFFRTYVARTATGIVTEMNRKQQSPKDAMAALDGLVSEVHQAYGLATRTTEVRAVLGPVFNAILAIRDTNHRIEGIPSGYFGLDDVLSGFVKGNLYVIGGNSGMGKTSLVCNLLEKFCIKDQRPGLFFTLEMTARQIVQQMICSHARIDAHRVRKGTVTEEEKARMVEAAMGFSSAPLRLNDAPTLSISELVAEARLQYKQAPFEVLAVDYLQLLSGPKSENRTQEVGAVTRGLKGLARQLNIPVIVTSPLRRNERADHRPILSDLRESGDIEHTADGVVFIHREGYYGLTENDTDALLIVAKNRFGPLMDVQVTWRKEFTRFDNPDFRHGEDQPY